MAISYVSSAAAQSSTVAMPSHQAGDMILVYAFRDGSTTLPTIPSGYGFGTRTGTTCCGVFAYKEAQSSSETTGTFTGATGIVVVVYRKASDESWAIAAYSSTSGSSNSITWAESVAFGGTINNRWYVRFCGHRTATNMLTNTPAGWTHRNGHASEVAAMDTNSSVTVDANSYGGTSKSVNASSGWASHVVQLLTYKETGDIWLASFRTAPTSPTVFERVGDLIVSVAYRGNSTPATPPSGYTLLSSGGIGSGRSMAIAYRISDTNVYAPLLNEWTNAEQTWNMVYRKSPDLGDWDTPTVADTGSNTGLAITYPDLTGSGNPHLFLRVSTTSTNNTTPSGWSKISSAAQDNVLDSNGTNVSGNANSVGGNTATLDVTDTWRAWTAQISAPLLLTADTGSFFAFF